jgi:hypothetical protein
MENMLKIMVEKVEYKQCDKCGVYRQPQLFKVKKQKRKACGFCRNKK